MKTLDWTEQKRPVAHISPKTIFSRLFNTKVTPPTEEEEVHLFSPSLSFFFFLSSFLYVLFILFYIFLGQKRRRVIVTFFGVLHPPRTAPRDLLVTDLSIYKKICWNQQHVTYMRGSKRACNLRVLPPRRVFSPPHATFSSRTSSENARVLVWCIPG